MSWVTVIWSMLMGACVAMALPHLLVGLWHRHAAHLFFVLATASVISIAVGELSMMRAESVEHFVHVVRWMQLPIFFLVVALVSFIHLYLGSGRIWLGISACAMRFACVIVNFVVKPSLSYREITGLRQLHFLGDNVSAAVGVISPRIYMAEFSSVLLFLFLVDASIGSWRKGTPDNHRRALVVGGSTAFFVLLGAGMAALTQHRVIEIPYIITFPFAALLFAMAFDLSSDLSRARIVAQKLEVSEASLHESEERFRTMADAAPVMIWMSGLDKLCTFFNKAWLDFTGRTMEQELGNGWVEGVHLDDIETCSKTYFDAFDARKPFVMQYRLKRRDGECRWITDNGVPRYGRHGNFRGYIGACVDITDLLEQQKALHESEERVALAADAAQLGAWELNTRTKDLWISDKARELFQFQLEGPVTYAEFQDRVHPEDRAMRDAALNRAIETQGGYEIEYRALLPDGTVRWISGRAQCVSDDKVLATVVDISPRKLAAEEARRQREQINLLSRVSLLGEMTASLAHELNQPLSAIVNNANAGMRFVDKGKADPDTLRELLVDMASDARRANDIIRNVRNTIKRGDQIRQLVSLNDVVTSVAHMVRPDAAVHSCEVEVSLANNLPAVVGDPTQIQQVLINLVGNAFEAMRDKAVNKRKVELTTEKNGDETIRVTVRDYGVGISNAARDRLFEQFFTTKEEGLGMGLAIVRSIIEAHGGKIDADNVADGVGARFYFTLPVTKKTC